MTAAAITGLGAVSALGTTANETWAALERGECGIRPLTRFDVRELASGLGGTVPGALGEAEQRPLAYALAAGAEALCDAGVSVAEARVALVLGTSLGSALLDLSGLAHGIARGLGLRGPALVISTACSSSTHAVGLARDLLRAGQAEVVLAGGTDELTPVLMAGFCALGVVSDRPCAPFSEPVGTSLGEGAGFVVVEPAARALERGARVRAWVRGYALSADAHHATSPDPTGAGVRRAIVGALGDAGLEPSVIDYVNAHGTGTAANDPAETRAIEATLGSGGRMPWVSSSKSFLGHAQGAAGILELIVTILGMEHDKLPPTMGFGAPRPRCPADPVAGSVPRPHRYDHALSLSAAFGGANAAVLVSREAGAKRSLRPRRVLVAGAALVGPGGATLGDLDGASLPLMGAAPRVAIERVVRGADPRGVDHLTRLLAAAVARAFEVAAIDPRNLRDRVGLFVGQTRVSAEAQRELDRSIDERGTARLSARAFSNLVLNAAAGAVTRMLGLRGPLTAVCSGASSGLTAAALAADHLAWRDDVDVIVAAGASELGDDSQSGAEGACAVVLTGIEHAAPWARVADWALAAEGEAPRLAGDGVVIDAAEVSADRGGLAGALALALAADKVRRGEARAVATDRRGAGVAIALEGGASTPPRGEVHP